MLQFNKTLFKTIQEAIWLVDNQDQLVARTQKAQEIEHSYRFNLLSVLEISRGQGCALHSTKDECLNCPLEGKVSPLGFPFVLLTKEEDKTEEFWGRVDSADGQLVLQVQNRPADQQKGSLFDYLNNVRELERKKIAQNLHDGIAQSVYSLMLEARGLKWAAEEEQPKKMKALDRHFSEVLNEIKDLAGELRPMAIDEFGLVQALEQFIERTNEMTGFEIDLTVTGAKQPLTEPVRIAIYRMIQEAVSNAMKYSGENLLYLSLDFAENQLAIRIQDNGAGFDMTQQGGGFGLANMRERASSIGSNLMIHSQPNQGTVIQLQVPLKEG